ncbi:MAG: HPr kinase/phosphorylase, partial [Ruminococcus sp.]|nr:HPr kinase/phosphorylase [Ruminococcus sp.]
MATEYSVSIKKIIDELSLEAVYIPTDPEKLFIKNSSVSRPGLQLSGYFDFFDNTRTLVFGHSELSYLSKFGAEQQYHVYNSLFEFGPPAVIVARSYEAPAPMVSAAEKHKIPIMQSDDITSVVVASLVTCLSSE